MVLSAQTIRSLCGASRVSRQDGEAHPMIHPFTERGIQNGRSYGLSIAGYYVRIAESHNMRPGQLQLGSTVEKFTMPDDVIAFVKDKSSWARKGLSVFNTVIEPGWCGYLTLELVFHGFGRVAIQTGDPIAQIIFHQLDQRAEKPYSGKYQNQEAGPQEARLEKA